MTIKKFLKGTIWKKLWKVVCCQNYSSRYWASLSPHIGKKCSKNIETDSHLTSIWCLSRRPKVIEFKWTDSREVALRWTTLMSVHWNQLCGNIPFLRTDFLERKDLSNILEWHSYTVFRMAFEDWPSVSTYSMFICITYKNHSSLYLYSNIQNW